MADLPRARAAAWKGARSFSRSLTTLVEAARSLVDDPADLALPG